MEVARRHFLAGATSGMMLDGIAPAFASERKQRKMADEKTYAAVAMQLAAQSVERAPDKAGARQQMLGTIASMEPKIRSAGIFVQQYAGSPVKLAVLPEYVLTSYPGRISIPDFADLAALEVGGPEYEAMGAMAQRLGMFIAGNAYEVDRHFPGLYFQTSFIIDPSGDVVLRYRRLNSMFAPTPHDVWSKYLDIYGIDGVFPVARTDIGNLAAIASEDGAARCGNFRAQFLRNWFAHRHAQGHCEARSRPGEHGLCRVGQHGWHRIVEFAGRVRRRQQHGGGLQGAGAGGIKRARNLYRICRNRSWRSARGTAKACDDKFPGAPAAGTFFRSLCW